MTQPGWDPFGERDVPFEHLAEVIEFPQKNGQPAPHEPNRGASSVRHPNGSWICIAHSPAAHATSQQADAFRYLQLVMTLAWKQAWNGWAEEPNERKTREGERE